VITTRTKVAVALTGVALAAVVLPGAMAAGTNGPPPVPITGGGVLRLHMAGDSDFFRFEPPTGSGQSTVTQRIRSKKCAASLNPATSLVTLSSTPAPPTGVVGLQDHSLGVKTATENGSGESSCNRVDASEALTLALSGTLAGKQIDVAELDLEAFNKVTVRADSYLGSKLVDTALLPTSEPAGKEWSDDDNVRWVLNPSQPFDRLVLSVDGSTPGGAFSLDGGDDGSAPGPLGTALQTKDTLFQLTEITGIIDCGETAPPVGGGSSPKATFSRGQNPNCTPLPYLLRTDPDDSVLLRKDASAQPGANFLLDIDWEPEAAVLPVPATTIDYDGDGPNPRQTVQWCRGTTAHPVLPEGQKWCLAKQSTELVSDGQMQVSERYYGAGDPRWAR
jgi:hypothetical protein